MARAPHILVVDDDTEIRSLVAQFLKKHGFRVESAADGAAMMTLFEAGRFDLVVLDLMLPGEDGLSLCRRLRTQSDVPIIMLTAMGEPTDRIVGLEMGADDYLPKPFNPRELLARIRAVMRRSDGNNEKIRDPADRADTIIFEGWRLDQAKRELHTPDGVLMPLTAGEYDLLAVLVENSQRILNRDQLLDLTRGREAGPFDRSIDVQISRLRRKIEVDAKVPAIIKTVRGGGYVLSCEVKRG
jgi:two-component system OmpR family response regulator